MTCNHSGEIPFQYIGGEKFQNYILKVKEKEANFNKSQLYKFRHKRRKSYDVTRIR